MAPKKRSAFDIKRAQVLKERRNKLNLKLYVPAEKSIRGRVAEFLDWAAKKYPGCIILYEEVAQAIFSLGRIQDKRSAPVKSARSQMSAASRILMDHYKRTVITEKGVGVRASIDDADILQGTLTKDAQRHCQTAKKLQRTASLINYQQLEEQLADMEGDPEMKEQLVELAKWFSDDLNKYLKTLKRPQMARALLPPPPEQ